ncbi:cytochrome P450 [Wilcoxina mikolae CBS 423.85]|nr:cytochrome P450 [Wilcoxina mikolae CBS 423.85]
MENANLWLTRGRLRRDQALKKTSLDEYNPRVEHHVAKFIKLLEKTEGKPVDAALLLRNMTFDIMADLGFGLDDYGMQEGTGDSSYSDLIYRYMWAVAVVGALRNLCQLLSLLPIDAGVREFQRKRQIIIDNRIKLGTSRRDVFSHLYEGDKQTGTKFTPTELAANAELMIIAGSDSTSSVLSFLFRELALHPEIQEKLYKEISLVSESELNVENTRPLPYLQAVVNESLRFWNPVPSGIQHQTGPEGVTVAGQYIPKNTVTRTHHMSLMRDDRYFPLGDKFIPERWIEDCAESVKDKRAFIPFGFGPHACVGKQLSLNELRLVTASVVKKFALEFGPGYDDKKFLSEWKEYLLVQIGSIEMKFVRRQ